MGQAPFVVSEDFVGGAVIEYWKMRNGFPKLPDRLADALIVDGEEFLLPRSSFCKSLLNIAGRRFAKRLEDNFIDTLSRLGSFLPQQTFGLGILDQQRHDFILARL
jgi:hypothetical protein